MVALVVSLAVCILFVTPPLVAASLAYALTQGYCVSGGGTYGFTAPPTSIPVGFPDGPSAHVNFFFFEPISAPIASVQLCIPTAMTNSGNEYGEAFTILLITGVSSYQTLTFDKISAGTPIATYTVPHKGVLPSPLCVSLTITSLDVVNSLHSGVFVLGGALPVGKGDGWYLFKGQQTPMAHLLITPAPPPPQPPTPPPSPTRTATRSCSPSVTSSVSVSPESRSRTPSLTPSISRTASVISSVSISASATLPPVSPPAVIASEPTYGALGVSLTSSIVLNFTQPMDESTVENGFRVVDTTTQVQLSGTFVWTSDQQLMTFVPGSLSPATEYQVTLSQTAMDVADTHMAGVFELTFTTSTAETCRPLFRWVAGRCEPGWQLYVVVAAACVAVVAALLCACCCWLRRRRAKRDYSDSGFRIYDGSSERLLTAERAMTDYADDEAVSWRSRSGLATPDNGPRGRSDLTRDGETTASGEYLALEGKCVVLVKDFGELAHSARVMYRKVEANKIRAATLVERLVAIGGMLDEVTRRMVTVLPTASLDDIGSLRNTLELLRSAAERSGALVDSWADFGTQDVALNFLGRILECLGGATFAPEFRVVSVELATQLAALRANRLFQANAPLAQSHVLDTTLWEARDLADLAQDKEAVPHQLAKCIATARELQDALIYHGSTLAELQQDLRRHGIETRELEAVASMMMKRQRAATANAIDFADIEMECVIAEGSFGTVYKAMLGSDEVAVKCFRRATLGDRDLRNFEEEVAAAIAVAHPNVVRTFGACFPPDPPCIIMEYAPRSLYDAIAAGLSWPERIRIVCGLASALEYLHSRAPPLLHRDIKSHNVLLTADGRPMLCDIGLAKHKAMMSSSGSMARSPRTAEQSTRAWQAPELLTMPQVFSPRSDIYALGMVMYELASGRMPFEEVTHPELLREAICAGTRPTIPVDQWGAPTEFIDLMKRCWAQAPEERPDAEAVGALCRGLGGDVELERTT